MRRVRAYLEGPATAADDSADALFGLTTGPAAVRLGFRRGYAMPTLPCPTCHHPTPRTVDAPTTIALVNYYRCDLCGAVWNVPKSDPYGPVQIVAVGIQPKPPPTQ